MSFTTGGPGKEHGTNKPPPTGRVQERSKGDTTCPTTSQNPSLWHPSWLNKACTNEEGLWVRWLAKDNPETNLIPIKPKTESHVAEQSSSVPLPYCPPPKCPFPIKSFALSAHASPQTIHFQVLDKSPVSGPGRGPPSCNRSILPIPFLPFTLSVLLNRKRDTNFVSQVYYTLTNVFLQFPFNFWNTSSIAQPNHWEC